jgi:hypothetical protein
MASITHTHTLTELRRFAREQAERDVRSGHPCRSERNIIAQTIGASRDWGDLVTDEEIEAAIADLGDGLHLVLNAYYLHRH